MLITISKLDSTPTFMVLSYFPSIAYSQAYSFHDKHDTSINQSLHFIENQIFLSLTCKLVGPEFIIIKPDLELTQPRGWTVGYTGQSEINI